VAGCRFDPVGGHCVDFSPIGRCKARIEKD
jgi:hypothetical protein